MANDRMYLRCTVCHKAVMIGSHLQTPWETYGYAGIGVDDALNIFFREHFHPDEDPTNHHFDIVFEDSDDEYIHEHYDELMALREKYIAEWVEKTKLAESAKENRERFISKICEEYTPSSIEDMVADARERRNKDEPDDILKIIRYLKEAKK